jgi:hypothetical protein
MPSVLPTVVMHPDVMVERLRQQQVTIKEQSTRISELAAMIRQANQQRGVRPKPSAGPVLLFCISFYITRETVPSAWAQRA